MDLTLNLFCVGVGTVDLIDDRDDGEAIGLGKAEVGHGLGLDPLGGIDQEDGALACRQTLGYLIGEVHMTWGIDEVELVAESIVGQISVADGP